MLVAFLLWKFIKKTKVVSLSEIPLLSALEQADQKDSDEYRDDSGSERIMPF